MWLCKGLDVTSDSEVLKPSPLWRQGQGGVQPTYNEYGGWGSDGTVRALAGIRSPEAKEPAARGAGR